MVAEDIHVVAKTLQDIFANLDIYFFNSAEHQE
jgi:hypothetical protein